MTEALPPLDLRNKATDSAIELKAGSSLFAVVDQRDPGTCGPYFTDRSRAVLWGFYTSMSNDDLKPRKAFDPSLRNTVNSWRPGVVATEWFFPTNQRAILEIVLNRTVIFSNLMIDPNPFSYVKYRYGAHDPVSTTVQLNLDNNNVSLAVKQFADDTSWLAPTIPKMTYYGLMTMFPQTHTKDARSGGAPSWIACSAPSMLDANRSFAQLFIPKSNEKVLPENYHEAVVEVRIRIHAPEELTAERYYYAVDWERMWLFFTAWLYQRFTIAQIAQAFPAVLEQLSPSNSKTALPSVTRILNLDANVVSIIVKHCHSLQDVMAILSINRHMRLNIYNRALIQSNLRMRFLPSWNSFFIVLAQQNSPERQNLLGLPRKTAKTDKWWVTGGVLFNEDFINDSSRSDQLLLPDKLGNFRKIELEPHLVLPLIRSTNSFMAMFGVLYSMNHHVTLPRLATLILNHNDSHGTASMALKATARMPEYMPAGQRTAAQMMSATTMVDYPHTISLTDSRGSWLHDITMPYFFLEPQFSTKIQNAKAYEKQRYDIAAYYIRLDKSAGRGGVRPQISASHQQALETPLMNQLFLYRGEKTLAYLTCYMLGGMPVEAKRAALPDRQMFDYVEIIVNARQLSKETMVFLRSHALALAYDTHHASTYSCVTSFIGDDRYHPHPSFVEGQSVSPYDLLATENIMIIRFDLTKTVNVDDAYYQAYMFMAAFIRLMAHQEHLTSSLWSPNY